ncbi:unnamed protein product [Vitrella brassicaformis CCMP3155]|uniref:Protein kinase domain-containing protein n=2 Tax=Vitrella brassicaformis TaxID=1169539 RepID=A0A0G4GRC9_VITBC|nr:unnamed protein product [Vitrella brassicaformis CCMP3155]|eukprot:CEM33096.1 unnamed protein product [Vitrella brassicaformis CCMP3155]
MDKSISREERDREFLDKTEEIARQEIEKRLQFAADLAKYDAIQLLQLYSEREHLQAECEWLQARCKYDSERIDALRNNMEIAKSNQAKLVKAVVAARKQTKEVESEIAALRAKIAELQEQLARSTASPPPPSLAPSSPSPQPHSLQDAGVQAHPHGKANGMQVHPHVVEGGTSTAVGDQSASLCAMETKTEVASKEQGVNVRPSLLTVEVGPSVPMVEGNPCSNPRVRNRYEVQAMPMAGGSFGNVWRGTQKRTKRPIVIKRLCKMKQEAVADAVETAQVYGAICKIVSPSLATVIEVLYDSSYFFIVMEDVAGRDVSALVQLYIDQKRSVPNHQCQWIALGLLEALDRLHTANLVHRDVKPNNIRWTPQGCKLIDFDECMFVGRPPTASGRAEREGFLPGTGVFRAPEEVKLPDGADGDMRQAYQLIEQMLILDPSKRITAKAALRHPWLAGLSVADVPDQCHQ